MKQFILLSRIFPPTARPQSYISIEKEIHKENPQRNTLHIVIAEKISRLVIVLVGVLE